MGLRSFFLEREVFTYPQNFAPTTDYVGAIEQNHVSDNATYDGRDDPPRVGYSPGYRDASRSVTDVVYALAPEAFRVEDEFIYGKVIIKPRVGLADGRQLEWDERHNIYNPVPTPYGDGYELG